MAVTQGDEISRRIFDKRRPSYAHGWWEKVTVIIETVEPGTSAWAMGAAVPSLSKVIQLGPEPCGSHNLRKSSRRVHVPEDTHAHVQRHARWDRCRPVSRKGKNTHTLICSSPPPSPASLCPGVAARACGGGAAQEYADGGQWSCGHVVNWAVT